MKTNLKQLESLKQSRDEAVKNYNRYLKDYNKEHEIESRNINQEIISLHRKGVSKADIITRGYNKNYVNQLIHLYGKQKRVSKTTVAKFFPKPDKKKKQ